MIQSCENLARLFWLTVFLTLSAGCASTTPGAQIDWVDFIKLDEITYLAVHREAGRPLEDSDLGPEYARVTFKLAGNVHDPNYHARDGDAAFLDPDTRVYTVKGYSPKFRLAARRNGRLILYEADTNPNARRGADLLDIDGKVRYIGVNSEQDGVTDWNVQLVGQIGGGPTEAVAVQGDRAYIGVGAWFAVLDITDPTHPEKLGQGPKLPDILRDIKVVGSYAYVVARDASTREAGVWIIDIIDPRMPAALGSYQEMGIESVDVAGQYAYVPTVWGLRVLDVSDPAMPREAGTYNGSSRAYGIHVVDGYAYTAESTYGLRVVDVSDPTTPTEVARFQTPARAKDVQVADGYAYVVTGGELHVPPLLHVLDVSDPTAPVEVGTYTLSGTGEDVDVVDQYAYVVTAAGLHIIDISDPTQPREVGTYQTPGYTQQVDMAGTHAYVADRVQGLHVIDVTDPTIPVGIGVYQVPQYVDSACATGKYVYVISWRDLQIVDVSNPGAPVEVGALDLETQGIPMDVAVGGDYAYVAVYQDAGLWVIDISDPTAPRQVGTYAPSARTVQVVGDRAYLPARDGLHIFDISDPTALKELNIYQMHPIPGNIFVSGVYAYVGTSSGLHIIDVSNPAAPAEVGVYDAALGSVGAIYIAGDPSTSSEPALSLPKEQALSQSKGQGYAYISVRGDPISSLLILDVSNPATPVPVATHDLPESATDIYVAGKYAYLTLNEAGLRVLDISSPTAPREVGAYDTPGYARQVHVAGIYTYVADSSGGLLILRFTPSGTRHVYLPVILMSGDTGKRTEK